MDFWQEAWARQEHIVFWQEAWARWFNKNGDRTISTQDFGASIRMMNEATGKHDDATIQDILNQVEADSSGTMDFQKFLTLMVNNGTVVQGPERAARYERLHTH